MAKKLQFILGVTAGLKINTVRGKIFFEGFSKKPLMLTKAAFI